MYTTYEDALIQLQEFGLLVDRIDINDRYRRVKHEADGTKGKSGYYKLHYVGQFVDGIYGSWRMREKAYRIQRRDKLAQSRTDWNKHKDEAIKRAIESAEEQARQHKESAQKAKSAWAEASENGTSQYLKRKMIQPKGVKFDGSTIIVPACKNGELVSLQYIFEDGSKKYMYGGDINGAYCLLPGSDKVVLCEGYATGVSVWMATGYHVAVCFSASGLIAAAPYFKGKNCMICADNDEATAKKTRNIGVDAAKQAGALIDAPILIVDNGGDLDITDFNDYHVKHGLEGLRRFFSEN